tara:strand:- start:7311 stop:7928 length:618 start_codon:yes stop_codon:yes gene_type:complete
MKSLLKFSLITIFVFICSCNTESVVSDDELIELIINSKDKVSIAESELPSISLNYLKIEYEEDYVDQSILAPKYGYEIALISMSPLEFGKDKGDVYFDLNGRKLERTKDKGKKKSKSCFKLKYPINLGFSDGSELEVNDRKEHGEAIKKWHSENKDSKETVKILYPLTVLLYDFENKNVVEMQMNGDDDFKALKEKCSKSKEKKD